MKSSAGLMRINHTHGISMGHIIDASFISSCDIFWNHYGDRRVKVTRQDAAALRWLRRRGGTRSGTSSKGPHLGLRMHNDHQPD
jgi:hypothetical protein